MNVPTDFARFANRLTVVGRIRLDTPLHVGAGKTTEAIASELPVVKDAAERPMIPGSSLRGALRARVESILRSAMGERGACDPFGDPCVKDTDIKKWKDEARTVGRARDSHILERIEERSCLACRLFGSSWMASPLSIKDSPVVEESWFGHYEVRNGVAINRDTETVDEGKLFDMEVVPPGTCFECEMVLENSTLAEQGLLLLALSEMGLESNGKGRLPLGGMKSRGLGWVTLVDVDIDYVEDVWGLIEERSVRLGRSDIQARREALDAEMRKGR